MATVKRRVRVPRPHGVWRDPRFVVGVLLIVTSVLGCTMLVSHARRGVEIYQASRDIAPGEVLDATNTVIVEARPASDVYIEAGDLGENTIATSALRSGELISSGATGAVDHFAQRRVMLNVAQGLPESVSPGTTLELWHIPPRGIGTGEKPAPSRVSSNANLIRIAEQKGTMTVSGGVQIEVRVAADDLPRVLEAMADDGTFSAVPVGG